MMWKVVETLDRRWVFLFVAVAVIVPTVFPFETPIPITEPTRSAYATIEALDEGSFVVLSLGYGPSSRAELQPQAEAILRHCFRRGVRVFVMSLWADAPPLGAEAIRKVTESDEFRDPANERSRIKPGVDFVDVGYRHGFETVILRMASDIPGFFKTDARGEPLGSMPIMQGIKGFDQVDLAVDLAAGESADWWIRYGNGRFGVDLVVGVTGVIVSQMFPYLDSSQLLGLVGGGIGAAEYETLVRAPAAGTRRVGALSVVHGVVILLVVLGNAIHLRRRAGGEAA